MRALTKRKANWALFAAIVGSGMSFIDGTAVNVALPVLQRELHASLASVQWVIESYGLFLSALMLIGGSLGDLYGRRCVYAWGIGIFALGSAACALAPNVEVLIAARSVQGVGGALAVPGSLALITASFSGADRGRAIGTWSGFSAMTAAIGPLLGGWLVQFASWRWVFFINVPLAVLVLIVLQLRVDESRDEGAIRKVDVLGATLATGGLGTLVYGLIRLQGGTLDPFGLAATAAGALMLAAFVPSCSVRARSQPRTSTRSSSTRPLAAACTSFRSISSTCRGTRRRLPGPRCYRSSQSWSRFRASPAASWRASARAFRSSPGLRSRRRGSLSSRLRVSVTRIGRRSFPERCSWAAAVRSLLHRSPRRLWTPRPRRTPGLHQESTMQSRGSRA